MHLPFPRRLNGIRVGQLTTTVPRGTLFPATHCCRLPSGRDHFGAGFAMGMGDHLFAIDGTIYRVLSAAERPGLSTFVVGDVVGLLSLRYLVPQVHDTASATSQRPAPMSNRPVTRLRRIPAGATFSRTMNTVNTANQARFITPTTNNRAINSQQQPGSRSRAVVPSGIHLESHRASW